MQFQRSAKFGQLFFRRRLVLQLLRLEREDRQDVPTRKSVPELQHQHRKLQAVISGAKFLNVKQKQNVCRHKWSLLLLYKLEELLHCVDQEPERLTFLRFVR